MYDSSFGRIFRGGTDLINRCKNTCNPRCFCLVVVTSFHRRCHGDANLTENVNNCIIYIYIYIYMSICTSLSHWFVHNWSIPGGKDLRIDANLTSIEPIGVGSMSNRRRSEGLCYLGSSPHVCPVGYPQPCKARFDSIALRYAFRPPNKTAFLCTYSPRGLHVLNNIDPCRVVLRWCADLCAKHTCRCMRK